MSATKRGVYVECAVCGFAKQPIGRSVPLPLIGSFCNDECPGYEQEPFVGSLWPRETDEGFGYLCCDRGTEPVQ